MAHANDGVPVDPTSADIRRSLTQDLVFRHHVAADIYIDDGQIRPT